MPKATTKKISKKPASVKQEVQTNRTEKLMSVPQPVDTNVRRPSKKVLIIGGLIVVLGLLAYICFRWLVVAWVDRTPITRIAMYQQLESRYGKDLEDQMVTEALITNEAKNRKVTVSKDELNAEIKKIEDQQGGSDKLDQILNFQGMTRSDLEKQLSYQLLIKKMFGSGINVSDDEVNQYIESNKDQLGTVDEATKTQIKDQLLMQKIGQAFNTWLTGAKDSNRVVRYN